MLLTYTYKGTKGLQNLINCSYRLVDIKVLNFPSSNNNDTEFIQVTLLRCKMRLNNNNNNNNMRPITLLINWDGL